MNRILTAVLGFSLVIGLGAVSPAWAADQESIHPAFLDETLFASSACQVEQIAETASTDLVVLDEGMAEGFRRGMMVQVQHGNRLVAEIILVAVSAEHSVGIIVNLAQGQTIKVGDWARVKTFKLS